MTDALRQAFDESCELAKRGEDRQALKVLDDAIVSAERGSLGSWVSTLARHASVIADHAGDLNLSQKYCERALAWNAEDSLMLYRLADILHRQGNAAAAGQYALRSYRICANRSGVTDRGLVELLLHQWPELASEESGIDGPGKSKGEL